MLLKRLDHSIMEDEPQDVELNIVYAHEALDRAFLIEDMFDGYLVNHPFVSQNAKLKEQAEKISSDLFDLYQTISKEYERYESNDRDGDL
jgi:hypothetical protein